VAETLQGSTSEARLLGDERFLRKVAYLYYENGNSQETIAESENCSRQTVGKAIQKAKERGIVRISIIPDMRTGYLRNLSREVRLQLDLEDLVLVPGHNMNSVASNEIIDEVVIDITTTAAEYLDQMLTDTDILAVSGGATFMRNLVRYLKPTKVLPHMQAVATIGFVEARAGFGDANVIAFDIAQAYGATHLWFPCPAFVHTHEQLSLIRQLPIVKETYEMMERASVVVMGLWTPNTNDRMIMRGILTPEQIEVIDSYKPVVDINHWVFDDAGQCINNLIVPPPYLLSGMEIPRLKDRIQNDNTKVILIAGGSPAYIPAIRAALKAGLANILVTDHVTAQLLQMDN
jgi:deoxyribonucleoside regulator